MHRTEFAIVSFAIAVFTASAPRPIKPDCPRGTLPAYSHNDYLNVHPLFDALSFGYKGAEADVFLVNGKLQLGHERRSAEEDGTLEALYLRPLRALVARCGTLTGDGQPFLLTLEIKEESRPTFDTLVAVLSRYSELFSRQRKQAAASGRREPPPVQAVLVGWYPSGFADSVAVPLSRQARLLSASGPPSDAGDRGVGLIGLDYEKTIERRLQTPWHRRRWFSAIRATKAEFPAQRFRAYHVPVDERIYRKLLAAGVDLIGTVRLAETARLLHSIAGQDEKP